MPRPKRADEAKGIYHALNRGNARSEIFRKAADYEAFERIHAEGRERYPCRILSYQLMRYHAHYGTSGEGHVYQGRFKSFPIQDDDHFFVASRYVERNALQAN